MILNKIEPKKVLNKAFLKVKPGRDEIEKFKINLVKLLDQINEKESEEFHKNIISEFLKNTYYGNHHYINTKGRYDLVIHNGKDNNSTVGVIIETKSPKNKNEMISPNNLNAKAFHELMFYFLQERTHRTGTFLFFHQSAQRREPAFNSCNGLKGQFRQKKNRSIAYHGVFF